MSLIKKHPMTARHLAANRENQKLRRVPVVDERRERIRAALQRFGFDTQAEELAMRALGEEPAHFQDLLGGLWEEYDPSGASQEGVVISLARALWLMNRAARMQEGYAVRQALEVSNGRHDRVHAQMMRLKMVEERLRRLAQAVARDRYVTTPQDLEKMKNLHQEGVLKDMGEIALALFYELQPPEVGKDGVDRDEVSRRALVRIKEIFGLNSDTPPPAQKTIWNAGQPQFCQQGADGTIANVPPASGRLPGSQQDAGVTKAGVPPASSRLPGGQQDAGVTKAGVPPASSRLPGSQQDAGVTKGDVPLASSRPLRSQQDAGVTKGDVPPASGRLPGGQQDAGVTKGDVPPASSRLPGSQQDAGVTKADVPLASSRPLRSQQDAGVTKGDVPPASSRLPGGQQDAGVTKADVPPASSRLPGSQQDAGVTKADVPPASSRLPGGQQDAGVTKADVPPASSRPLVSVQDAGPTAEQQEKRYPSIRAAEWEARERPRQLLENILTRQMEACAAQRKVILKESVKGPSPYERAAEIAPTHPNAKLMRRMQDSNLREVRRLTNLLLKIKRYERESEGLARSNEKKGRSFQRSTRSRRG